MNSVRSVDVKCGGVVEITVMKCETSLENRGGGTDGKPEKTRKNTKKEKDFYMTLPAANHEKRILWFQDRLIPDKVLTYMVTRKRGEYTRGYSV